ncbi:zinc finger SWIM domain-containing protein 6 [Hydra vulgaris]|uniref:zinc finger SWIM domain-containing protein 6 n=1 Tax=Hydra vulgaris TaxID=6087 RepID=UPI0001925AA3|nr:zinc finger SWIM domain-containing protein 6 [Hydra vulgaris]
MASKKKRHCVMECSGSKKPKILNHVRSLLDITSQCIASNFPYEEVEQKIGCIPSPVLKRILYYAFPLKESSIEMYSSNKLYANTTDLLKQPFHTGLKLVETGSVDDVVQIGFHLNGTVQERIGICSKQKIYTFKCSINFDRNCITSTQCSCSKKNLLWCSHVVALAIYRIRNADSIPIKPPISDSIVQLKKKDLQKLLLMLVSSHKNDILPSVQKLLDEITVPNSEFNLICGLPDPTAGGSCGEDIIWFMDQENIKEQIKIDMVEGTAGRNVIAHLNKVREMLAAKDSNYLNLLTAVTDAILEESINKPQIQVCHRVQRIYDELQSLWFCVFLNPNLPNSIKNKLRTYLYKYFECDLCPTENYDDKHSKKLLQEVVNCDNSKDDLFILASTVESLRLCGCEEKALNLSQKALQIQRQLDKKNFFGSNTNPIQIFYNCFTDNSLDSEAFEIAIISLFNSFELPKGEYAQNRLTHRCEKLISLLEKHDIKNVEIKAILTRYSNEFYSRFSNVPNRLNILPNHCFARYIFESLSTSDVSLAFQLGLYFLPLVLNKNETENEDEDQLVLENLRFNDTSCYVISHVEHQQGELASSLLKVCLINPSYLKITLNSILDDVKNPSQLVRLSKICRDTAVTEQKVNGEITNSTNEELLGAAFELSVRSVRLVNNIDERKTCIRWLVSCAVETGRRAIEFIIRNWNDLFEAKEISSDVGPILTSQPVFFHLNLTSLNDKEKLLSDIRTMVIEACIKDPVPCTLFALTLCENETESLELVCQIVYESSPRFNTAQLFSVARYLESKKHHQKAFKIAIQALKKLDIGPLENQHPAICDVLWLGSLACTLGMDELTQLIPVIENCIHNPLLLTEIAQRCETMNTHSGIKYSCLHEPLNRLIAYAQKLFVQDVEIKLHSITRKNYLDFTKYLQKIRKAFTLSEDGAEQFHWLIDYIMTSQRGKKKLHQVLSETFLCCQ